MKRILNIGLALALMLATITSAPPRADAAPLDGDAVSVLLRADEGYLGWEQFLPSITVRSGVEAAFGFYAGGSPQIEVSIDLQSYHIVLDLNQPPSAIIDSPRIDFAIDDMDFGGPILGIDMAATGSQPFAACIGGSPLPVQDPSLTCDQFGATEPNPDGFYHSFTPSPSATTTIVYTILVDVDADGVFDHEDNCPIPNPDQIDLDEDGIGDACDPVVAIDSDGDGWLDGDDNCPAIANPDQADFDADGLGDACDDDDDADGVDDVDDACSGTTAAGDSPPEPKKRRYSIDEAGEFVDGDGNSAGYSVADTSGCSGAQIIEAMGLGRGHLRFGITASALQDWIELQAS